MTFVDQCVWQDSLVELQLWCRLGIIANRANDTENTLYARDKTLNLITLFQTRKVEKYAASKLISLSSGTARTLSLLVDTDFNYH